MSWRALFVALAVFLGSPAQASDFTKGIVVGKTIFSVKINGVPEVGKVLTPAATIPAGSACSWLSNGTQVSTSCVSYTVAAGDVGHTITLQITTAGVSAFAALTITGTPPSTGTVGTLYSFTPGSSGGSGGNVFSQAGSLPPGIGFTSSTGALSGTPTLAGTYSGLGITVTDSVGGSAVLAANPFTITISSAGGGCAAGSLLFTCTGNALALTTLF